MKTIWTVAFLVSGLLTQPFCYAAKPVQPQGVEKAKAPSKSTRAIKEKSLALIQEIMDRRPFKSLGEFETLLGTKLFVFDVCEFHSDQKPNDEIDGAVLFADEKQADPKLDDVVKAAIGEVGPVELFFNDKTKLTYKDVLSQFGKDFSTTPLFGIPSDRTGLETKTICYKDKTGFTEFEFFNKAPYRLHRVVISALAEESKTAITNADAKSIFECIEKIRYAQPLTTDKFGAFSGLNLYSKRGADYCSMISPFGIFTRARAKATPQRRGVGDVVIDLNRNCKFDPDTLHSIYGNPTEVYTMKHENADVCERDVYIYKQDDLTLTFKFREVSKGKWQGESITFKQEPRRLDLN